MFFFFKAPRILRAAVPRISPPYFVSFCKIFRQLSQEQHNFTAISPDTGSSHCNSATLAAPTHCTNVSPVLQVIHQLHLKSRSHPTAPTFHQYFKSFLSYIENQDHIQAVSFSPSSDLESKFWPSQHSSTLEAHQFLFQFRITVAQGDALVTIDLNSG